MKTKILLSLILLGMSAEAWAGLSAYHPQGRDVVTRHGAVIVPALQQSGRTGEVKIEADPIHDERMIRIVSVVHVNPNGSVNPEKLMACEGAKKRSIKDVSWILPGHGYQFNEYLVDLRGRRDGRDGRGRNGRINNPRRGDRGGHLGGHPCSVENAQRKLQRLIRQGVRPDSSVRVLGSLSLRGILGRD